MTVHWTQFFSKVLISFTYSSKIAPFINIKCLFTLRLLRFFTTVLPKTQSSFALYLWTCSSLLCLKGPTSNHQPRPVVLWFLSHKGLQTSQNNSVSVLNRNVKAHWNSLLIQPLSSRDSVLYWCDKSWIHIASLKTKSCKRSYLTQATDTHPSLTTGTVARRSIHGRLVQCRIETESDSPAVQLTFVRRWMEIQLQLEHRLHVSMCNCQLSKHKCFLNSFITNWCR